MEPSVLDEVRLTSFKSFHDARLPLGSIALLVGRNGSGKSNALDGLWVLSRLALGEDIRDALDGGRDGPAVRGGVEGCAPFGQKSFSLGCTVRTGPYIAGLDVTVQTEPVVKITHERLWEVAQRGRMSPLRPRDLLLTEPAKKDSNDIVARWDNRRSRPWPALTFRASRLLTTQVASRVPTNSAGLAVHRAAKQPSTTSVRNPAVSRAC
jgi:AAA domain, putative AbiEii toxin, Type IV TA system